MGLWQYLARSRQKRQLASARQHLTADTWPDAIYAVGDIHGCVEELTHLHDLIEEDAKQFSGEKWLVYLGDYVDRGPSSARVLDQLTATPRPGWRSLPLVGNHEVMMLGFLDRPHRNHEWLRFGGLETLSSYGVNPHDLLQLPKRERVSRLQACIPDEHMDFLLGLPLSLLLPGTVFVHAGIRRGVALQHQSEDDLLWIRDEFFDAPPDPDLLVVHGHTPAADPIVAAGRICVDTGAFATGTLTAACLTQHSAPWFLKATKIAKVTLSR